MNRNDKETTPDPEEVDPEEVEEPVITTTLNPQGDQQVNTHLLTKFVEI